MPYKPAAEHNPGLLDRAKILLPLEEELALWEVFCADRLEAQVKTTVEKLWFSFIPHMTMLLKKINIGRYADESIVSLVRFISPRLDATNSDDWGLFACICSRPRSMHA